VTLIWTPKKIGPQPAAVKSGSAASSKKFDQDRSIDQPLRISSEMAAAHPSCLRCAQAASAPHSVRRQRQRRQVNASAALPKSGQRLGHGITRG
jgi:hypothetical protein